jgi:hypothetical protein
MAYNDALIRSQFPEFSDTTKYPQALLSGYWSMGSNFITASGSPCNAITGDGLAMALNYMACHLYVLGARAASGPSPGSAQGGFQTGSNIDGVSVQKLAPPIKGAWSWWLAQTTYGQTLWALLSVAGVGGLSVGGVAERESFRKGGGIFL